MGAFHAPHVAGEALKTAVFASALFSQLGFGVTPTVEEKRGDIIQVMMLENAKNLIAFCKGVQKGAPVDSFVVPEPSDMPGYDSQVIMAAGAFTLGSSIELSADAPLRQAYRCLACRAASITTAASLACSWQPRRCWTRAC